MKVREGIVIERNERMYVSSLEPQRLTPAQWLLVVRSHWGVENQNHHTLDTAFAEDDRPWRKDLLSRVRDALVALTPEHIVGLRPRQIAPATR
jgi:predicted transposase YbfD/YdcC